MNVIRETSGKCQVGDADHASTPAVSTVGANYFLVWVSSINGTPVITDDQSNDYGTALFSFVGASTLRLTAFGVANPTTNASMAFHSTLTNGYSALIVQAFSGVDTADPIDAISSGADAVDTLLQMAALTPAETNEMVVTGVGIGGQTMSINESFSTPEQQAGVFTVTFGAAAAYKAFGAPAVSDPTWTGSGSDAIVGFQIALRGTDTGDPIIDSSPADVSSSSEDIVIEDDFVLLPGVQGKDVKISLVDEDSVSASSQSSSHDATPVTSVTIDMSRCANFVIEVASKTGDGTFSIQVEQSFDRINWVPIGDPLEAVGDKLVQKLTDGPHGLIRFSATGLGSCEITIRVAGMVVKLSW